jgi:large subunit ribosomal protein L15
MQKANTIKIKANKMKRVGRGYGSGKGGHTVGRGSKGQKARSHIDVLFEGLKVKKSLLKKLPLQRGKGRNKPAKKALVVRIDYLNLMPDGAEVTIESLIKNKIVDAKIARGFGVKILGGGKLTKKLKILVPMSKSAAKQVENV